jgi:hypothetical protein
MKSAITYWHGFKAKYTGKSEMLYGKECFEVVLLEGYKKGEKISTYRKPGESVADLSKK